MKSALPACADDRQAAEARKEEVKQRLREEGLLGAEEYFYEVIGFWAATLRLAGCTQG